jgi:ankyrin repeat protein
MDLLLQHGADINAKVTGTKTYTMRISRAPSSNEGMTALHVASQTGRLEVVKFLLDKGASPDVLDANGKKAIDLVGTPRGSGRDGQPVAAAVGAAPVAGARGGANAANPAEVKALLQDAETKK